MTSQDVAKACQKYGFIRGDTIANEESSELKARYNSWLAHWESRCGLAPDLSEQKRFWLLPSRNKDYEFMVIDTGNLDPEPGESAKFKCWGFKCWGFSRGNSSGYWTLRRRESSRASSLLASALEIDQHFQPWGVGIGEGGQKYSPGIIQVDGVYEGSYNSLKPKLLVRVHRNSEPQRLRYGGMAYDIRIESKRELYSWGKEGKDAKILEPLVLSAIKSGDPIPLLIHLEETSENLKEIFETIASGWWLPSSSGEDESPEQLEIQKDLQDALASITY